MSDLVVLGAEGALGSALVARFGEAGMRVRPVAHVDAGDVPAVIAGAGIVIDATGTAGPSRRAVATAAVDTGAHLVDPTPEQHHVRWLVHDVSGRAAAAGVTIVASAGLVGGIGGLLGVRAAEVVAVPSQAHVAYLVLDGAARATAGQRAAANALLGEPGVALVDGVHEPERLAEARRLAWFARPVGPHHAAGVAGPDAVLLPPQVATLATVRSYAAVRTAKAELLQLVGNAARWEPARRRLERLLTGPGRRDPAASARWAVVAEVEGRDGVARAWANGRGVHHATAAVVASVVDRLVAPGGAAVPAGTVAVSQLGSATDLLDDLAPRCDLRWSVVRPDDVSEAAPR